MRTMWRVLYILLALATTVNGQSVNTKLQDVSLPTPTAAALGEYIDVPVSHATRSTEYQSPHSYHKFRPALRRSAIELPQ